MCHRVCEAVRDVFKIEEYKKAKLNTHATHSSFCFATAKNYTAHLQTVVFQCTACTIDEIVTSEFHSRVLMYKREAK